jgi:hypothetical protein
MGMKAIILGLLGRIPRPTPAMGVALIALLVAASGAAVATIPNADGSINGCYAKDGTLKIIDTGAGQTCSSKEGSVRLASATGRAKSQTQTSSTG